MLEVLEELELEEILEEVLEGVLGDHSAQNKDNVSLSSPFAVEALAPLPHEHPCGKGAAASQFSLQDVKTWPPLSFSTHCFQLVVFSSLFLTSPLSRPPSASGSRREGREGLEVGAQRMKRAGSIPHQPPRQIFLHSPPAATATAAFWGLGSCGKDMLDGRGGCGTTLKVSQRLKYL